MRDVATPWRTLAPAWPRPSRPWFGAAAFPSPEGPQRYPLRCSTRTAAAELTHWLDAFIRHLRVQTLPWQHRCGSTVLAETPSLSPLLGRLSRGSKAAPNPARVDLG